PATSSASPYTTLCRARVVVVSFLRDLEVNRPECHRWNPKTGEKSDETVPAPEHVKLNTAYSVGGPKCLTALIQQITHMRMQHFVDRKSTRLNSSHVSI